MDRYSPCHAELAQTAPIIPTTELSHVSKRMRMIRYKKLVQMGARGVNTINGAKIKR